MARPSPDNTPLTSLLAGFEEELDLDQNQPIDATAWFLGPKAENGDALKMLIKKAIKSQIEVRRKYMPEDPPIFIDEDGDHEKSIHRIKTELKKMLAKLQGSIPLASYRNQSHMYWDITLPATVGYFAAMLYNQNNVAAEASPVTTLLEIQVGKDLCEMLGFMMPLDTDRHDLHEPWGHITCDGSVANGESMWAARNLKYLPVALAAAIVNEEALEAAKCVTVQTCRGDWARLIDLDNRELLNLPVDEVIGLVARIEKQSGLDGTLVRHAVDTYSVQNVGLVQFQRRYLETYEEASPVVLTPATAHYSWPKTAALIGLGTDAVIPVEVDLNGRMCMKALRKTLYACLDAGRPVLQVVAVMGSTEEGAVDPLAEIVEMRREFQSMGLNFVIHVDGAWGGYFCSMLRFAGDTYDPAAVIDGFPQLYVSDHFQEHFAAIPQVDSVTLDPHKSGFVPYPAGGLCYRNGAMRDLIAFTAPVVFHGGVDVTVGPYGIEGSKPGAAPAAVYLSNKVIPLNLTGYGRLLGRCLFNSKRFYAALVSHGIDEADSAADKISVQVTAFQRLPTEKDVNDQSDVDKQKRYIAENFVECSTKVLIEDVLGLPTPDEKQQKALDLFQAIGSDLSIVTYAFNFTSAKGVNHDIGLMNDLNDRIFRKLSLQPSDKGKIPSAEMFVTASAFDPAHYGDTLVQNFAGRAGVDFDGKTPLKFLISTTQNPWLSTTSGDSMIPKLIKILYGTALESAAEIVRQHKPDQ